MICANRCLAPAPWSQVEPYGASRRPGCHSCEVTCQGSFATRRRAPSLKGMRVAGSGETGLQAGPSRADTRRQVCQVVTSTACYTARAVSRHPSAKGQDTVELMRSSSQSWSPELVAAARPDLSVLGLRVGRVSAADMLRLTAQWVAEARVQRARGGAVRTRQIVTLNPEMVMAARRDSELLALINRADLVLADGMGITLAARLRGVRDLARLPGVEAVQVLAACAAASGWRLYLLGAQPGVAASAGAALMARHPGLLIAGSHAGSPAPEDDTETVHLIRDAKADIVCVAYGAATQERWIARNRGTLGAAVAVGVGGTFDFLAERVPRAPAPVRRMGMEWAYRLWRQPRRWRRMLALPRFALLAVLEALGATRAGHAR